MATDNSGTNLIINYLPQTLSDDEFYELFSAVGPLQSSKILRDKHTGYSFGYGFVNYQNESDASKAIATLNGLQLQHKHIKVAYARPPTEDIRGANLYIANLPKNITEEKLRSIFSTYGNIINVKILTDKHTGFCKGCGFVLYSKKIEADLAVTSLNGTQPLGFTVNMTVKKAKDDDDRSLGSMPPSLNPYNFQPCAQPYAQPYAEPYAADSAPGPARRVRNHNRFNPVAPTQSHAFSNQSQGGFNLFVFNIGPEGDEKLLYSLFAPFGAVTKVDVMRDPLTGTGKGYGFVLMKSKEDADLAISQLNGFDIDGKRLQVSYKK